MNDLENNVIKIKEELIKRQTGSKKPIYNQKLQQFLMDWFQFRKLSNLSTSDIRSLAEIQSHFDKNDLFVYSKKHTVDSIRIDELSLHDPIAVHLRYKQSDSKNSGIIKVVDGLSKNSPYPFQQEAIDKLTIEVNQKNNYAGILVLPTGGGKTYTAVYWLLKNMIDNGKKVLWIAHRHSLLEQAFQTMQNNAYSKDANGVQLLNQCKTIRYRLISELHSRPNSCSHTDDIIIANKDSLSNGLKIRNGTIDASKSGLFNLYENWLKPHTKKELFIVFDECHHAIAKSYRFILDFIREMGISIKVLGLTATPIRVSPMEQGLLLKVFQDNITYSISINNLLDQGFLSYPRMLEEVKTGVDITASISKQEIEQIRSNDVDSISKASAQRLGESPERNQLILNHYLQNKSKYGQTIIFALNVQNAIALSKLFNDNQIKTDYILSGKFDKSQKQSAAEQNREKIEQFRNGDITILISYNILTEGVDIPKVQTIFLARPTISSILMTQMVGRGLRGEKVGGTKETYIVPFIDEWHGLISWLSPKKLLESDYKFADTQGALSHYILNTISTNTLEQIEAESANSIDPEVKKLLESWQFIERIPVGLYIIEVEKVVKSSSGLKYQFEREANILVYDHLQQAYKDCLAEFPRAFCKMQGVVYKLSNAELGDLVDHFEEHFFIGERTCIGYSREDLKDLILYYLATGEIPQFLLFEEREKYDIDKLAKTLYKKGFGGKKLSASIEKVWNDDKIGWQTFLGNNNFNVFKSALDLAMNKIGHPDHYQPSIQNPEVESENLDYQDMSLDMIKQNYPSYYKFLREEVFKRYRNRKGFYFVKNPRFSNPSRVYFTLDYIVPLSDEGKTVLSNLCLKKKDMNWAVNLP